MTDTEAPTPDSTDPEPSAPSAHSLLKDSERHHEPCRVTMGDSGPAVIKVSGLRSGGAFQFNRHDETHRSAILRLTPPEMRSLREARFDVEPVPESQVAESDVFSDPDDESTDTDSDSADSVSPDDWTLVTTPSRYVEQSPDGPKADLARALILAGHGNISTKSEG